MHHPVGEQAEASGKRDRLSGGIQAVESVAAEKAALFFGSLFLMPRSVEGRRLPPRVWRG